MADKCIIKFSGEDMALSGKSVEEAREAWVRIAKLQNPEEDVEGLKKSSIEQVGSKRENEKAVLLALLQPIIKDTKKVSEYNIITDLCAQIETADDQIVITKADWEKLREGFEKVTERPPWWVRCRELFKQLESPEETD